MGVVSNREGVNVAGENNWGDPMWSTFGSRLKRFLGVFKGVRNWADAGSSFGERVVDRIVVGSSLEYFALLGVSCEACETDDRRFLETT